MLIHGKHFISSLITIVTARSLTDGKDPIIKSDITVIYVEREEIAT